MKKRSVWNGLLALVAAAALTSCAQRDASTPHIPEPPDSAGEASVTPNRQTEFGSADLVAGGVAYGASREEVVAQFGEPASEEQYIEGATGDLFTELTYADGNVFWLVSDPEGGEARLRDVSIVSAGVAGPRGLQVGDAKETVLAAFRNDNEEENVLYDAGRIDIYGETQYFGPCGFVVDGIDYHRIVYYYPTEPYPQDIGEIFLYWTHGYLHFAIEDDAVTEIFWMVAPFAE